jgi:hypothetical protein
MKIPNAEKAVIAPEKLRDYLLNPAHRRGGSKACLLMTLGYSADQWQQLEADLHAEHLAADFDCESDSDYGKRYEIVAPLKGQSGRPVNFRSVWQIDTGTDYPRLITMYPE